MGGNYLGIMVFSSLEFLFMFLPVFLGIYHITQAKYRKWILLGGSLAFYTYGAVTNPWTILLFLGLMGGAFGAALWLEPEKKERRMVLAASLGILFGCLLGFKYAGLFGEGVILPLGISFYTFQLAAYLMDVYRKKIQPEKSFLQFATVIALFPKLISGPLTPYRSLSGSIGLRRAVSWRRFNRGLQDFILGLGLKVLLANQIGGIWRQIEAIGFESISTPLAWMGMVSFSLQLYFDFFGYSLMAIGLGHMIGVHLPQNFNTPYASRSMTEFWRRWHITLGKWFLEYIYIPLGGSREGRQRELRNLFLVWLLTGIWHGPTLNFILWSMFVLGLIILEKLWLGQYLKKYRIFSHCYLILTVMFSWMLFAIPEVGQIGVYLTRLFPFFGGAVIPATDFWRLGLQYGFFLLCGIVAATPQFMNWMGKLRKSHLGTAFLFLTFWLAVYCISAGLNDPFMYFSF